MTWIMYQRSGDLTKDLSAAADLFKKRTGRIAKYAEVGEKVDIVGSKIIVRVGMVPVGMLFLGDTEEVDRADKTREFADAEQTAKGGSKYWD